MTMLSILLILSVINIVILAATISSVTAKIKTVEDSLETHSEMSEYYFHKINKGVSSILVELRWESKLRQEELDYGSDSDMVDEETDAPSSIDLLMLLAGDRGLEISDEHVTEGNVVYLTYRCEE